MTDVSLRAGAERAGSRAPDRGATAWARCGIGLIPSYATDCGAVLTIQERVRVDVVPGDVHRDIASSSSRLFDATIAAMHPAGHAGGFVGILGAAPVPTGCGLKTSSAVVTALVLATAAATHTAMPMADLIGASADVQQRCGLTTAGSVDDTWASLLGGIVIAEGGTRRLMLRRLPPAGVEAVVLVPADRFPAAHRIDRRAAMRPYRRNVRRLMDRIAAGDLFAPATESAFLHSRIFGYDSAPLTSALAAGAYGAALSGKGPSRAAFSDAAGCARIETMWRAAYPTATVLRTAPCADGASCERIGISALNTEVRR